MAFATTDDIRKRLGKSTLTAAESDMATILLEGAQALIADAAGKDDAWVTALDPVPDVLKIVTVEATARAMENPSSLAAFREQLGAYQQSKNFRQAAEGGGVYLTDREERLVRRCVYGTNAGSAQVESTQIDEVYELTYGS